MAFIRVFKPASSLVGLGLALLACWLTPLGLIIIDSIGGAGLGAPMANWQSPGAAWRVPPELPGQPMFNTGSLLLGDEWLIASGDLRQTAAYYAQNLRSQRHAMGWTSLQQVAGSGLSWAWMLVVWAVPAGWMLRQTALEVAGRNRQPSGACALTVARRVPTMLAAPAIVLGLVALCMLFAGGCAWLAQQGSTGQLVGDTLSVIAMPLWLGAGLLSIGLLLVWPLMWAAAVIEPDVDPFDVLSRAFEYLLRRPIHAVFYLSFGWLLSIIFQQLVGGICGAAQQLVASAALLAGSLPSQATQTLLGSAAIAMSLNFFWAVVAALYMLLRRDANHVELDTVWEPATAQAVAMPEVPTPATTPETASVGPRMIRAEASEDREWQRSRSESAEETE
jgi:hypothetical protein